MHPISTADADFQDLKETVAKNVSMARDAAGWASRVKDAEHSADSVVQDRKGKVLNWTQEILAEKTGLSRATIAKIERSKASDISLSTLSKLAEAFGIPAFVLLMGKRDWKRIEGLTMLKDRQLIQELQELVHRRNSNVHGIPASEATARIEKLSKSDSEDERELAAKEIDHVVAALFQPKPVAATEGSTPKTAPHQQALDDEKAEQAIGTPRRIAAAIGTYMLPSIPFLNALITGLVSIPFEKLITKNKKG